MKKIFLLILVAFNAINANAQWQLTSCPIGAGDGIFSIATNGNYVFAGVEGLGVLVSTNNGSSWSPANTGLTSTYITSFTVNGSEVFTGSDAGIFHSVNNGTNWSPVNNGLSMIFVTCLANNGTSVFAGAGFGQIFRSDNNGTLWTEISNGLPSTIESMVTSFTFKDANVYTGMAGEGVYISANNGANWSPVNNGLSEPDVQCMTNIGGNILAGADDGLYLSSDSGSNWNLIDLGFPYINIGSFTNYGSRLFMGTNEGVFFSTDNGISWDSINTGLTEHNIWTLAINGNYIFANESQTGVWRRPLTEVIGEEEISSFNDLEVFPNPVSDILTVKSSIENPVENVRIYNYQGQLLKEIKPMSAKVDIDFSNYSNQIYILEIQGKNGTIRKKIVKQ
jgi:hypothetical protein